MTATARTTVSHNGISVVTLGPAAVRRCPRGICGGPDELGACTTCEAAPDADHTHDPALVNATTGQPCKGKMAARALAMLLTTPHIWSYLQANDPLALRQAEAALAPFDMAKLVVKS